MMLEKVKLALRISNDAFNDEISGLIAACKADLRLAGIDTKEKPPRYKKWNNDPLIERAVILYCKANYGFIEGNERYKAAYDLLKHSLSLAGDYRVME